MVKIIQIINEEFIAPNECLAVIFADSKEELSSEYSVSGLPTGRTLAQGSKFKTADGSEGYLKSDGTIEWVVEPSDLPPVDASDNGKVLVVEDGQWAVGETPVTPEDIQEAVNAYCAANFSEWAGGLDSGLTQPLMAAPADKVGELKSALTNSTYHFLKDYTNIYEDTINVTGTYVPYYYRVFSGKTYTFKNKSATGAMLAYTRATPDGANIDNILGTGAAAGYTKTFTATADTNYIVVYVNTQTTDGKFEIIQDGNMLDTISAQGSAISTLDGKFKKVINPKSGTVHIGERYNVSDGTMGGNDSTSVTYPDYIELNNTLATTIENINDDRYIGGELTISNVLYYDAGKTYISREILSPHGTATIPLNTKFVRFGYTIQNTTMTELLADTFNIVIKEEVNNVIDYVEDVFGANNPTLYVGANRTGANTFTTMKAVTEYIWNNNIEGATVYVDKGIYDLETEFGSEWLEAWEAPQYNPKASGLKVGKHTHYIFEHGAIIKFLYSGENTDIANYFSPINIAGSCIFDNMQIEAQNCRYCVHEDYYTINTTYEPYQVEYNNCEMLYKTKTLEGGVNGEPIGAGCMPGSVSVINGGCFINENNQAEISYHNYATSSFGNGTSMVVIKNAYMSHWCGFGLYGDSVVYGYVNGCRMKMEAQNGYVNNVIRQWGNTIEAN